MSDLQTPPQNLTLDFSAKDPVCGMIVEPAQARGKARYAGETYFFCSPGCMHKFTANPAKYLTGAPAESTSGPVAAPRTAKKPDKDLVCGMTVDPSTAAATVEHDRKLYHFCSRGCAEKFQRDPKRYLDASYKPAGMAGIVQIGGAPIQGTAPKLGKSPAAQGRASVQLGEKDP